MSHEIENMLYTGETPWHGLGIKLESPPTIEEAIVKAGLDWTVRIEELVRKDNSETVTSRATVRSSDNTTLGVVGSVYTPLQNIDAFKFFQPFIDSGKVEIHTAGSLRQGQRVWVLCRLKTGASEIIPGDFVEKFFLLSNGHDGLMPVRVGFTPIRVVCANTLGMAHNDKGSELLRLKHCTSIVANLDAVRDIINIADQTFEATADQYRNLAQRQINETDLKKYVRSVFSLSEFKLDPSLSDSENEQKRISFEARQKVMGRVIDLFNTGRGNQMPGVQGTYWSAYNSVTEYLGYERGRNQDNRLDALWFGQGKELNQKALSTALVMAA